MPSTQSHLKIRLTKKLWYCMRDSYRALFLLSITNNSIFFQYFVCIQPNYGLNSSIDDKDWASITDSIFIIGWWIQSIVELISKLRTVCKKIRGSEQLRNQFELLCAPANITYVKPILDVKTRWDSTLDMIRTAFRLKPALTLLYETNTTVKNLAISVVEWEVLEKLMKFLRPFKQISKMLAV